MTRTVDAVVIGSGHNGLAAAAYLARAGWSVEVVERADRPGGAVATEELTLPGFRHDTFSSWHPLFTGSATYAELGPELEQRGLRYVNTDTPTAAAHGDGQAVVAYRDVQRTAESFAPEDAAAFVAELDRFGRMADVVGGLLSSELHAPRAAAQILRLARRLGPRGSLAAAAFSVQSARGWLESSFAGPEPELLYAPWVLHTGLEPSAAGGALQLVALAGGLHAGGTPVVEGGSEHFVTAFTRLIADHGGTVRTGVDAQEIRVVDGRAVGVVAGGELIGARRAVIAGVTPTQLYGRLLAAAAGPSASPSPSLAAAARAASRFRFGRGAMQIHLALSEPLRWRDPRLDDAAIVHLSDGAAAVDLACAQAASGRLPARPTVVCGQPCTVDPSRAPAGQAILWIQLQEVPYAPAADAAGELDTTGGWTPELAGAYADRVLARIAEHAPNLSAALLQRAILTPIDLEQRNINLHRGDPYAGATHLDQALLWRPLPGHGSHRTPVDGLWQIGASTHPGPGLNAASGRMVAQRLIDGDGRVVAAARRIRRMSR
jgi:phytoene dehydrogenase-like protein